jgi:UPF0176 protein
MDKPFLIARFYCFADFPDFAEWQGRLKGLLRQGGCRGTILIAPEGINGTIAGPRSSLDEIFNTLRAHPGFEKLSPKFTPSEFIPFEKIKVRLKREIVTLKQPVDFANVGTYVKPEQWNDLISDPNTVTIDTRNDFEYAYGHFAGAVDPGTERFSQLPAWVEKNQDKLAGKKIAMYCTGGIRCEKSTAYLRAQGYSEVYHLEGGILGYLETVPAEQSLWQGDCFVFDDRVIA